MSVIDNLGTSWAPRLLSVLRIVTAFLYMMHGTQKIWAFPGASANRPWTPVDWASLTGASAILELVGGALLLIGLFSRPLAFLLSGHMAFAYFIGHAPRNLWPILNGGELAIMMCFTFLYLSAAGPGPWSVDAARRRA